MKKCILFFVLHPFKVYFALRLLGGLGSWFSSLIINLLKKNLKINSPSHFKNIFSQKCQKWIQLEKVNS